MQFRLGALCVFAFFSSFCELAAAGTTVFINEMRAVHRLTNRARVPYLSRLIELKHVRWSADEK